MDGIMITNGEMGALLLVLPEPEYFKTSAAAAYLGISPNTLRKYTDLGLIWARRLPDGARLYKREWLDYFAESLDPAVEPPNQQTMFVMSSKGMDNKGDPTCPRTPNRKEDS